MTPRETVQALYEADGDPGGLARDLELFDLLDTPTAFALYREEEHEGQKGWFVWAAAGDLAELVASVPYPLPWIGWARGGHRRWYRLKRLLKRFDIG